MDGSDMSARLVQLQKARLASVWTLGRLTEERLPQELNALLGMAVMRGNEILVKAALSKLETPIEVMPLKSKMLNDVHPPKHPSFKMVTLLGWNSVRDVQLEKVYLLLPKVVRASGNVTTVRFVPLNT